MHYGASESKFLYFTLNINYVTGGTEKIITKGMQGYSKIVNV